MRVGALRFLVGRRGHVEPAVVKRHRSGYPRERVRLNRADPSACSALRVEGIDVCGRVAEIHRAVVADCDGGTNAARRGKRPHDAAVDAHERVDGTVLTADVDPGSGSGRLSPCGRGVREAEGPLQCELRNVADGELRGVGRLKPRVVRLRAPAEPRDWLVSRGTAHRAFSPRGAADIVVDRAAGQKLGDRAPLAAGHARSLHAHGSVDKALDDCLR